MALVHTLFAEDRVTDRLPGRVNGLDDLRALAVDFAPERVADVTGIPADVIRRTARELAAADRAAVYGRIGTCTQAYGTLNSWLVDALNVLTGNLDREGGAMFPRPRTRPCTGAGSRSRPGGGAAASAGCPRSTGSFRSPRSWTRSRRQAKARSRR